MIHLSMSAGAPTDLPESDFDDYICRRHLEFAKRLEGLRLLSATKVERFHGSGTAAAPAWFVDAWWDGEKAVKRCLRSAGGLALIGDRMTMMTDPIPAVADATEQVRHETATAALFDLSVGPRASAGTPKLHVMVPAGRDSDIDSVIDSFGPGWPHTGGSGVGAFSVSRGTGNSYPLNNVITGVTPPVLPAVTPRGSALELWFTGGADLDSVDATRAALQPLLDDPQVTWWYGKSREVMMSLPVASFIALDPEVDKP